MNLCFTYLHGNVKARVCHWVYEVFYNAIITPPQSSVPIIHTKSWRHKTVGSVSYNVENAEFSILPACEGFWGAARCYSTTLAKALQSWGKRATRSAAPWVHQQQPKATGQQFCGGVVVGFHHCPPEQQQSQGQPKSDSLSHQEQISQSVARAWSALFSLTFLCA